MQAVEVPVIRASVRQKRPDEPYGGLESTAAMNELSMLKERVPAFRERLGSKKWSLLVDVTFSRDPRVQPISRAYYKLKEIMHTCVIDPPGCSVHLCEAPGGFVQAVSEKASDDWEWTAVSLCTTDSPKPRFDLLPMERGTFLSADVLDFDNCISLLRKDCATLVTADGAHDVHHDTLERDNFFLMLAQTRLAVYTLKAGGTFILKFFEGGRFETLALLAHLTQLFENVSIIKPTASRPTNSERYIVARNFSGVRDIPDISQTFVSSAWLRGVQTLMDEFARVQSKQIERVLSHRA